MKSISIDEIHFFDTYYVYPEAKIREMAAEFLSDHNIKPLWHFYSGC
jgi:vacuolar-type H+-ATPase subunit C/Vma6